MITQDHINDLARLLPFGDGKQVAKKAKVSEAMVSMLFNGKISNLETNVVARIIEASVKVIHERSEQRSSLRKKLKNLIEDLEESR